MADNGWTSQRPVAELATPVVEPLSDFFQALRRIESLHREWPRLGEAADPAQEAVRLGQDPSLAFPGSPLVSEEPHDAGTPLRINVRSFGVFGSDGPMPLHLSEYAFQRQHSFRDPTLVRFADVFHHRLLSLLYRAWANAQPTVSSDRPDDDRIAGYVDALIGQAAARTQAGEAARTARYLARHLVGQTRHPEGLVKVLRELLHVPVALEEFVGEWLQVPSEYCWRLASNGPTGSTPNGVLGTSSRVGTEVWQTQFKFRIVLGPLQRGTYERFLPRGDLMPLLAQTVQRYIGHELSWDVCLVLDEPAMQTAALGLSGRLGETSYLGQTASGQTSTRKALVVDPFARAS